MDITLANLPADERKVHFGLSYSEWRTGHEVQQYIMHYLNKLYSESTVTRRIRELRAHGIEIEMRRRKDSTAYEYRLV